MKIGILNEPDEESRVALLPEGVEEITQKLKAEILLETNAGASTHSSDEAYKNAGAEILSRKEVFEKADLILSINKPGDKELMSMGDNQVLLTMLQPLSYPDLVKTLKDNNKTTFSLDSIPRITRAQSMDVLSSQATVAGYKAVLEAANRLSRFFPLFMTAAGTIKPAKVLILGAGVAGLQAIATARRLGAVVEAFDVRSAVKEEVKSLGGKFIEVEGAKETQAAGGYAVEQTEEYKQKQKQLIHEHAAKADVVITTAQIPGKQAPELLEETTVKAMKPGSVIVDLAASSGGNCKLTKNNEVYDYDDRITIIGKSNYPSEMPIDASRMFGKNVIHFLKLIIDNEGNMNLNFEDEVVKGTCITYKGEVYNQKVKAFIES
ncbi:MAG: Re/Si-specific NAD(P)(+) transhydrogenase subunit alpha [Bacteroidales bacterium]|nr:Re/Si-specific NAD(P)(+) transhydrogenase subunit alpha [Bacteroidales bacterium]MCF8333914.1 Re/Si-specific NAD(P)(+) transhydrogenase subunit alpha [Bacteroidales bacterium]